MSKSKLAELVEWMDVELHELEIYIQAQEKSPEHIWHPGAKSNTIADLAHQQQRLMEWREQARQFLAEEEAEKATPSCKVCNDTGFVMVGYGDNASGEGCSACPGPYTPTAPADKGLVEIEKRINYLMKGLHKDNSAYRFGLAVLNEIEDMSRHTEAKQEEPLAVLADRKGLKIKAEGNWLTASGNHYRIDFSNGKQIVGDSPHREHAEAKARAYLNTLPDKHTEKGETK
jgi:hypothetical protein